MASTTDRTLEDANYAAAIRTELGSGTLGVDAPSRQRWRDEAGRLERNVASAPLKDMDGEDVTEAPAWRRLRYVLPDDANMTEAVMVVADDHDGPEGTVFTVRQEHADAVRLDEDGGTWVRPELLDAITADRMGIAVDGTTVAHLTVDGTNGEAVVQVERVVADNGQRIEWTAEYIHQRAHGFTAENVLGALGYKPNGQGRVLPILTSELVAAEKSKVMLDGVAGHCWELPAAVAAEWHEASQELGYSAGQDELIADIELASGVDDQYTASSVNPEAARYDAAVAAVRAAAVRVEAIEPVRDGSNSATADTAEFDSYADRSAAQQRHPSMRGACGQTVKSTRMPCRLTAGHRGRHRSR